MEILPFINIRAGANPTYVPRLRGRSRFDAANARLGYLSIVPVRLIFLCNSKTP